MPHWWWLERARRLGLVDGPDREGGRWSADAAERIREGLEELRAKVGALPDLGAGRAVEVLGERLGIEVSGDGGMAYQRVYGTPERPIDVLAEVRGGDVVLIPHGWHGPSMAAPGHDLYYLNVMAGPSPERAWRICDDPAHAWVRGTWSGQAVDPRLPLTSAKGRS